MALEIIKNIAEAEQKGDAIKTSALQNAEQLKIDAEIKCKEILVKSRNEAKLTSTKLIQQSIESAQVNLAEILSKADEDCTKISKIASEKMSAAVNAIIGKVVGIDGNS